MAEERRARTKHASHVSVRLDAATMIRVEAVAPLFSTEWRTASRSDVLRGLILDALDRFEQGARPEGWRGAAPEKAGAKPAAGKKGKRGAKPKR